MSLMPAAETDATALVAAAGIITVVWLCIIAYEHTIPFLTAFVREWKRNGPD